MHPHAIIGIVQAGFFGTVFFPAGIIFLKNWKYELRWASWPLVSFAFFQVVVGVLSFFCQKFPDNHRLHDATTILVNMGVSPLMSVIVGFLNKVLVAGLNRGNCGLYLPPVINILFWTTSAVQWIGLFIMHHFPKVSLRMTQAGYMFYGFILLLMTIELFLLSTQKRRPFDEIRHTFINLSLVSIIPLFTRVVYGILCVFTVDKDSMWNPITGSVPAGVAMCLIAEAIPYFLFSYLACAYYDDKTTDGRYVIRFSPRTSPESSPAQSPKGSIA